MYECPIGGMVYALVLGTSFYRFDSYIGYKNIYKQTAMEKVFKTLYQGKKVELISYVRQYVAEHPDIEILIGCDSQNRKRESIYAVVIGLYTPGKGAHVLYSRFSTTRERENTVRLLNEVWHSIETAELQIGRAHV